MKKIVFIWLILCSFSTFSQKNDLEKEKLRGKIKVVTTMVYENPNGSDMEYVDFPIAEAKFYNENGNITNILEFDNKKAFEGKPKANYYYDSEGKLTEIKKFPLEGEPYIGEKYEYNSLNKLEKITFFKEKGSKSYEQFYIYDEKNRLTRLDKHENGKLIQSTSYKNDEKGNILEEIVIIDNNEKTKILREYDQENNEIKTKNYESGRLVRETFIKYDEFGNTIEIKKIYFKDDGKEEISKMEYTNTYDTENNLILQVIEGKSYIKVTKRNIEYYQ